MVSGVGINVKADVQNFGVTLGRLHLVNGDVDFPLPQKHRHLAVVLLARIMKVIEGLHQPLPHDAAIVRPERDRGNFKLRTVMALEHLRRQGGGDVAVEIGGEIGDTNFVMAIAFAVP